MGLIKAAGKAVSTTLKDQWKEFIKCENMDNNTLMIKKTTENGVITKKSAIEVAPGQIAVIFQSGKILDATAEEGIYTFDESSSPSFSQATLEQYLKKCGLVLHLMEQLIKIKQYSL